MTSGDHIPIPRLRPNWDEERSESKNAAGQAPRRSTRPWWRASQTVPVPVPVAVAVVVAVLLQQYADGISTGQSVALLILVLIGAFIEHQYLKRR